MYLGYRILEKIFINTSGIRDAELRFNTVSASGTVKQPRGLFIPLFHNEDDLMDAINNGAIAAIWAEGRPTPAFTPNLFPIFRTKNMKEDVEKMLEVYLENIKEETVEIEVTHFLISGGRLHSEITNQTALSEEMIKLVEDIEAVGRG